MITPTYRRPHRLAEITRIAQTLMSVENLEWIVVEDALKTSPMVERILKATLLKYQVTSWVVDKRFGIFMPIIQYLTAKTPAESQEWLIQLSGNEQRSRGIDFLRAKYKLFNTGNDPIISTNAVVYFGDDDNSYDLRLFNNYIRAINKIGVWAVGLAGGVSVVTPLIDPVSKIINGWKYMRRHDFGDFPLDIAGFGVGLDLLLRSNATFRHCRGESPEPCFFRQLNFTQPEMQTFGCEPDSNGLKEILAWHTKTTSVVTPTSISFNEE